VYDAAVHRMDRGRFEALLEPELRVLHATALRLAVPPDDAADLVQETCLRAFRTSGNFVPGTNARAWLLSILWSIHANRRRRNRRAAMLSIEELEARVPGFELADSDADQRLLRDADSKGWGDEVDAALRELPGDFREPVLLVDVAEMSYEDAARVLGCPVGTVRSRLFRGRRVLASLLAEYARKRMRSGAP
jgi:RNA polymerase sigma-70 factor (ECF subfamily)